MDITLKLAIYRAIDQTIQKHAKEPTWAELIHSGLVNQMADAAEAVFDAAQDAQLFAKCESNKTTI